MSLAPGTRLGAYEILTLIGARFDEARCAIVREGGEITTFRSRVEAISRCGDTRPCAVVHGTAFGTFVATSLRQRPGSTLPGGRTTGDARRIASDLRAVRPFMMTMKILRIVGARTDDERNAVREVLAIWDHDGTCSADLMQRLPATRLEILIVFDDPYQTCEAMIVIENGIVAFHPLDNSEPETIH